VSDATFAEGTARALRLVAVDEEDLAVVSALLQDAVTTASDLRWARGERRFAALLNRFRWEARLDDPERVRAVLSVEGVTAVRSQGVPQDDSVLSLLSMAWEAGEDGAGRLLMTFAGDGMVAVEAEALDLQLRDVTRPYRAVSGRAPEHPDG
jgi:hypothetical protein